MPANHEFQRPVCDNHDQLRFIRKRVKKAMIRFRNTSMANIAQENSRPAARVIPALFGAAMAVLLAACSGERAEVGAGAPPVSAGEVNIYSARHYDSDRAMFDAFEAKTGIKVRVRQGDASQLLETMKQEGKASPADLVIAADAGTLWLFDEAGLLSPITDAALLARIPADLRASDDSWIGLSQRLRVIVIDPARIAPGEIANYRDLADPRYKGEICVRSSTNIYNLSLLADLIDRWGEAEAQSWAEGVVANMARAPQGGDTDQIRAVAAGECSIAIVNHYYWLRLSNSPADADRAAADATMVILPDGSPGGDGVHRNITGAALTASAPNRENAVALLDFLASADGQAMLIVETGELPIDPAVPGMAGLQPFAGADVRRLDLSKLGQNQATARIIFDRAGWN